MNGKKAVSIVVVDEGEDRFVEIAYADGQTIRKAVAGTQSQRASLESRKRLTPTTYAPLRGNTVVSSVLRTENFLSSFTPTASAFPERDLQPA